MMSQDTARERLGRRKEGAGERRQEEEEQPSHPTKGTYRGVGAGTKEAISKFLPTLLPKTNPRTSLVSLGQDIS